MISWWRPTLARPPPRKTNAHADTIEERMPKKVERNGTRIRIIDDATGREVWNGRTDSNPPEYIRYSEDGIKKTIMVDQSTDAELIHALECLLNPT